ncbi:MAG: hypothetical protein ACP5N7_07085 [Candidatus Pacearchaeota archaeon]
MKFKKDSNKKVITYVLLIVLGLIFLKKDFLLSNWREITPIILSLIAIAFTGLKDFILPYFFRPELKVTYESKTPFRRQANIVSGPNQWVIGFYDRFKVENIGNDSAKNCRCQIYSIKENNGQEFDVQGFPIKWASRPDSAADFTKAERLNIGPGESEFVDLVRTQSDNSRDFYLSPYHNIPIGMTSQIPIKDYIIKVIISGDNFKPYIAVFEVKPDSQKSVYLSVKLKEVIIK